VGGKKVKRHNAAENGLLKLTDMPILMNMANPLQDTLTQWAVEAGMGGNPWRNGRLMKS
jgi:hypothetical protein